LHQGLCTQRSQRIWGWAKPSGINRRTMEGRVKYLCQFDALDSSLSQGVVLDTYEHIYLLYMAVTRRWRRDTVFDSCPPKITVIRSPRIASSLPAPTTFSHLATATRPAVAPQDSVSLTCARHDRQRSSSQLVATPPPPSFSLLSLVARHVHPRSSSPAQSCPPSHPHWALQQPPEQLWRTRGQTERARQGGSPPYGTDAHG
jgi:hypothetical protein